MRVLSAHSAPVSYAECFVEVEDVIGLVKVMLELGVIDELVDGGVRDRRPQF